jgi:hypothetical protein
MMIKKERYMINTENKVSIQTIKLRDLDSLTNRISKDSIIMDGMSLKIALVIIINLAILDSPGFNKVDLADNTQLIFHLEISLLKEPRKSLKMPLEMNCNNFFFIYEI